jgi:hypothetical protein
MLDDDSHATDGHAHGIAGTLQHASHLVSLGFIGKDGDVELIHG